jgi:transcriptional regulator with XRE-family HTH domain
MAANGYKDQRLADELSLSRSAITRIRRGERKPSLDVALRLERITGLPIGALVGAGA